jgi:hypothetical protein
MKTTIQTIFAAFLLTSAAMTAQNNNNLVVFSEAGDRFYLILNGLKYNQTPETNIKVTGLNATHYKAKIIFEKPAADLDGTVHLMWEGVAVTNKEFSYEVVRKGEHHKLKFVSQADIGGGTISNGVVYQADGSSAGNANSDASSANVSGGGVTTGVNSGSVSTNVNGGGYNTTVTTTTAATGPQGGNVGISMNADGMNMSVNVNATGPNGASTMTSNNTTVTTTSTTYSSSSSSYGTSSGNMQNNIASTSGTTNMNSAGSNTCYASMNDPDFTNLVNSITAKDFEDVRLKIAKQGVSANCVSAAQVRKLMDLFTFEESKLDITKYSYDRTVDKNNYYLVNDGFGFESSVDNLNDYISKKK